MRGAVDTRVPVRVLACERVALFGPACVRPRSFARHLYRRWGLPRVALFAPSLRMPPQLSAFPSPPMGSPAG